MYRSCDRERACAGVGVARRLAGPALALLASLLLSACLPMGLVITSYASEGAAYLATGKSLRDHAISGLMEEDCALLRLTDGDPVCVAETGAPEQIIPELARTEDCRIWRVAPQGVVCVVRRDDPMPRLVATGQCPAALNIDGRMVCVQPGPASGGEMPASGTAPAPVPVAAPGPASGWPPQAPSSAPAVPSLTPYGLF